MDTSTKNLLFLLGAAPMSAAGCSVPGDEGTFTTFNTTSNNDADETGESGADGDGDGDTGDGDGDGDTGDGDGDGDTGDGDGDGDGDTGDGDGDGDTGDGDGDPVNACMVYAQTYALCAGYQYYYQYGYMYCQYALNYAQFYGADCVAAYEDYMICLSQLTCQQFDFKTGCEAEEQVIASACQ